MIFLFNSLALAVTRFDKDQLIFLLYEEGANDTTCTHFPLKESDPNAPDLPWWSVNCGNRAYTVDVWYEETDLGNNLKNIRFMFHAKESTSSSGDKSTQFQTHTTDIVTTSNQLMGISSYLDVRNGLADLHVMARIGK